MYHHSNAGKKPVSPLLIDSTNMYSRETLFDPLNYAFDAETMIEPFTYFHDGPGESRRKPTTFSLISSPTASSSSYPWSPASSISPLDEHAPSYYPQINNMLPLKHVQQPTPPSPSSYPKTICLHCKSHNMPECLYTSHSMYDESGEIFCPVLKKCHCANCIRVINSSNRQDDDSDDDNNLRYPFHKNDFNHHYLNPYRTNSYRLMNTNNSF